MTSCDSVLFKAQPIPRGSEPLLANPFPSFVGASPCSRMWVKRMDFANNAHRLLPSFQRQWRFFFDLLRVVENPFSRASGNSTFHS